MKWYSDYPGRRTRQILTDVVAAALIALWAWVGVVVYQLVIGLQGFGQQMEDAGAGFRGTMTDIKVQLTGVPLIGAGIAGPFDQASAAGASLEQAGRVQQEAVAQLAIGLSIGIAVLPVLTILLLWLIPRFRFARRAGSAKRVADQPASVDLLALRAISRQKLAKLAEVHPDVAGAWRAGDREVITALASLELKSSGVRLR
jgi:hypothetical protein